MQDDCEPCQAPQSRAGAGKRPRHLPHRQKYAKLHRLTQLLDTGQIASVFQELECDVDSDFLPANPELLFELHRYYTLHDAVPELVGMGVQLSVGTACCNFCTAVSYRILCCKLQTPNLLPSHVVLLCVQANVLP